MRLYAIPLLRYRLMLQHNNIIPFIRPRAVLVRPTSIRTFWGFQKSSPAPNVTGISAIEKLVGSLDTQEGHPPSDDVLVEAFRDVVGSWKNSRVSDEHAHGLARTYEYLKRSPGGVGIPVDDLRAALKALRIGTSAHVAGLARVLFNGIGEVTGDDVVVFVGILSNSGNTAEAVEVVRRCDEVVLDAGTMRKCWEKVLGGFAVEGDEESLLATWGLLRENKVELTARQFHPVVKFYCHRGDVEAAKRWYYRVVDEAGLVPTLSTFVEVLRLCAEKEETEWAQEIIASILNGGKKKGLVSREAWDVVLQWTGAIVKENPSNEVSRLLTIMEKRADTSKIPPNIETFNGLIRFAISRGDYKEARKYHKLAIHHKYEPNRTTIGLQIEYLTLSGKLELAREIYEQLKQEDIPKSYEAREAKILLRALCKAPEPDMEVIRHIYLDLNDWETKFDVGTLSALLNLFLTQCNFQEVITLLSRDTAAYSARDRRRVIHEIGEYIGRNTTSIEAAWDSYQILYQIFPELSIRQRTDIMRLFFELDRSDMATMVFKHMRGTPGRRPNKYTYTIAFHGVAYSRDIEALKVIHNALKLDQAVDLDTRLINSLMNAYNRCGVPERALQFWEDIKKSTEGPDYESISVVLETCGNMWDGWISQARIIWGQLKAMGIRPSIDNYCSYIGALGKHEQFEDAFRIVKEMEINDGVKPDVKLLGTIYVTTSPNLKPEVAGWATETYPAEWKEVEERLKSIPEDVLVDEVLEQLVGGPLQKLVQESQQMMLAIEDSEKVEEVRVKHPAYTKP